jgi:DNA-binding transcriptional MerR regulator
MKISELSRLSGVPSTTIKFYIREGLIPAGTRSHRNQATYNEDHLRRLGLIQTLREIAGLSLDVVRNVLSEVGKPWGEADPVGAALGAIYRVPERERSSAEQAEYTRVRGEIEKLVEGLHWMVSKDLLSTSHHYVDNLTDSLLQMRRYIDPEFPIEALSRFAEGAWGLSEQVFAVFEDHHPRPSDDIVNPTSSAILGTLLLEPMLMALTRTALAAYSARISAGLPLPSSRDLSS